MDGTSYSRVCPGLNFSLATATIERRRVLRCFFLKADNIFEKFYHFDLILSSVCFEKLFVKIVKCTVSESKLLDIIENIFS